MKYLKILVIIFLMTFSFQTTTFAFLDMKKIMCSDKCDGLIRDDICVPTTNENEINVKDLCIAKVKEEAKHSLLGMIVMLFLFGWLLASNTRDLSKKIKS